MSTRPNVLYLHCHDAGRYVQPYHPSIPTPNMQRFAEEGVLFRQAFTANPTCSPSRACLMTGQWAHCNGMLGLAHRGFRLDDYSKVLPHYLAENGYRTLLCGVQHVVAEPHSQVEEAGYTDVLNRDGGFEAPTTAAITFLREGPQEPFFLDVGYFAPHRAGEGFNTMVRRTDSRYTQVPDPLPDCEVIRDDMSLYEASVHSTDICFGRVLEALEESGQAANTLVIITTDHGIAFPHMKCNLTDHGIGVMLMMRGPGAFSGGKVVDAMVTHLDIFPTICEAAGLPKPDWLQGKPLAPVVRGELTDLHEAIFAEVNYHAAYEPKRCIRTNRWKYIRHYDQRHRIVLPNCDNSPSKTYMYEHGWLDRERPEELLYDLAFDPGETQNLAGDPAYGTTLNELRQQLDSWMEETDDPALLGPVPAPANAKITDPDFFSTADGPKSH